MGAIDDFLRNAAHVKRTAGRGYGEQIREVMHLRRVNSTCGISDYYSFGLFDRRLFTLDEFRDIAGWRVEQDVSASLNSRGAVAPAWDKLMFATIADSHGLRTPVIKAVFKPNGVAPDFVPVTLRDRDGIRAFLADDDNFPLFMKPAWGQQGFGGFLLTGSERDGSVVLGSGERMPFERLMALSVDFPKRDYYRREAGYLFQDVLSQHPEISDFTGSEAVSGLRFVVLNEDSGPKIHRVIWKTVCAGNHSDNFSRGKYGNLVCDVDTRSGAVSDGIDGFRPLAGIHPNHPVSSRAFADFRVPMWETVCRSVLDASMAFSTMRILHWDVVVDETEPVFLELNDIGATQFLQLHGRGLLDEGFRAFMRQHGGLAKYERLRKLVS